MKRILVSPLLIVYFYGDLIINQINNVIMCPHSSLFVASDPFLFHSMGKVLLLQSFNPYLLLWLILPAVYVFVLVFTYWESGRFLALFSHSARVLEKFFRTGTYFQRDQAYAYLLDLKASDVFEKALDSRISTELAAIGLLKLESNDVSLMKKVFYSGYCALPACRTLIMKKEIQFFLSSLNIIFDARRKVFALLSLIKIDENFNRQIDNRAILDLLASATCWSVTVENGYWESDANICYDPSVADYYCSVCLKPEYYCKCGRRFIGTSYSKDCYLKDVISIQELHDCKKSVAETLLILATKDQSCLIQEFYYYFYS